MLRSTIRLHDTQAWYLQREMSREKSFNVTRCNLQWDEVALGGVSWSVIFVNALRPDGLRERELIACVKLLPVESGASKTGANVGNALKTSLSEFDLSLKQLDYVMSDDTACAQIYAR